MCEGLGDENGVTPPERLPASQWAHLRLRPPVSSARLLRSVRGASTSWRRGPICAVGGGIGIGPVFAKSCCALGCVESCRSISRDARVATREDVGAVGTFRTGLDLAASEIVQDCCQGIETEAHLCQEENRKGWGD
jgi:hypothetical protein